MTTCSVCWTASVAKGEAVAGSRVQSWESWAGGGAGAGESPKWLEQVSAESLSVLGLSLDTRRVVGC